MPLVTPMKRTVVSKPSTPMSTQITLSSLKTPQIQRTSFSLKTHPDFTPEPRSAQRRVTTQRMPKNLQILQKKSFLSQLPKKEQKKGVKVALTGVAGGEKARRSTRLRKQKQV